MESIKIQTYQDYEIIIPEGTDLPTARNNGIRQAKGDWIFPLDVDDTIDIHLFEKTIGRGDIVATGHKEGNAEYYPEDVSLDAFMEGNRIVACTVFKKKVWEDIGGYDESMKDGYEDWDFWLRALKAGYKITVIQEPLFIQTLHSDSMIHKTKQKHEELKKYILSK
jgi:GT2 family glycosyltransferase